MRGFGGVTSEGLGDKDPRSLMYKYLTFAQCPIQSLHAKLITSESNIKLSHISCFQQPGSRCQCHTLFLIRAGTPYSLHFKV